MPAPPPTAYPPGTKLTVGSHAVEIVKFIGEGGFAHVYTVVAQPPIAGEEITCLKRVQVPNKAYLNLLRAEVDAMQRLKGSSNIVQYFDSHAERMHNATGQYEVFLLMEFCERGGLIDFMNTRLRDQLREIEILKIMYDITLGLAHMHYLAPPLLHRDLKIENVLITGDGTFKLCDFGSVSPVLRSPKNPQEFQILEDDIQHHTTVQYRSPEMVDIRRGHPIDEKSDIWALGIFLYKLCYYTTPFERPNQTLDQFQQLILSGTYTIPPRPAYSERLRNMIRVLLQQDPRARPNSFQVMQEICDMRRIDCPIKDIYSQRQLQQQVLPPGAVTAGVPAPGIGSNSIPLLNQDVPPAMGQLPLVANQPVVAPTIPAATNPALTVPTAMPPNASTNVLSSSARSGAPPGHQRSASNTRPLPAQVPHRVSVSSVLSPKNLPMSPERSVSPLDDTSLSSRYPTLQELDGGEQLNSWSDGKDGLYSNNTNKSPKQERNPSVSAEAVKLKEILTGISGKSNTVILQNPQDSNLSSVDFLKTLKPTETQHSKSKPRKSSVPLFHPKPSSQKFDNQKYEKLYDDNGDDDDYDDEETYHPSEPSSNYQISKSVRRSMSILGLSDSESSTDSVEGSSPPAKPKASNIGKSSGPLKPLKPLKPAKPAGIKLPGQLKDSNTDTLAKLHHHSTSSPDVTSASLNSSTLTSTKLSNASKQQSHQILPSSSSPSVLPKPRNKSTLVEPQLISPSAGELDPFKPSNIIQQRVHSFLSSQDRQHPPRRTARGYGRYTDVEYSDEDGSDEDNRLSRSNSTNEDVASPQLPSRALKPKLK